jgi:hypothetical protein
MDNENKSRHRFYHLVVNPDSIKWIIWASLLGDPIFGCRIVDRKLIRSDCLRRIVLQGYRTQVEKEDDPHEKKDDM